jgi:hypothetical protein
MRSRLRPAAVLVGVAALSLAPLPASAGELAAELQAGYFSMAASKSADAVFGSSGGFTWGGAVRYTFFKSLYASVGARTFSKSGERVFVAGPTDEVARLGFPLSARITPIDLIVGYRFRDGQLVVPYGGVGATITRYSEESSVADIDYDKSSTKAGLRVVGGVEVGRGRFRLGAEAGWSTVPDAIGVAGVSNVYNEDDIGGWSVVGKVVFAFGGKPQAEGEDAEDADEEASEDDGPPEPQGR